MKARTVCLAVLMLIFGASPARSAWADEMGLRSYGSPHDSAVPGEYFFQKGVEAVNKNDYRHAVAMYKVAASWAYKMAEYNLGVIFVRGEGGVPEDYAQGFAWLTLAAERNDRQFVAARDMVRRQLNVEELAQADRILADLKKTYGDEVALPRAKARWREVRTSATGSHLGFTGSNLQVGDSAPRGTNAPPIKNASTAKGAFGLSSSGDFTGGHQTDGSISYRELRETDNPYDARFDVGTVTVGPLTPADDKNAKGAENREQTPPSDRERE
jgi:hypothetical protein